MIRANLKAGGSLVRAGADVSITASTNMVFSLPTDSEYALIATTVADQYGSDLTALIDLSDPSNPFFEHDTGSFGTLSGITYASGTLTITFSGAPSGSTVSATPLKVA